MMWNWLQDQCIQILGGGSIVAIVAAGVVSWLRQPSAGGAEVIAAVVTAAGNLIGKLLERGGTSIKADSKSSKRSKETIKATYDTLRKGITNTCLKLILFLENGEGRLPDQIAEHVHRLSALSMASDPDAKDLFLRESTYRLLYLKTLGMITNIGESEYAITKLGAEFLAESRNRREYSDVFNAARGG